MSAIEGSLSKWTNVMKGWQYRWFVLDEHAGLLSYYTSREKMMRGVRRGCVRLKGAVIGIDDEDDSTFTITVDSKTFHFQARDADERDKWMRALEETIVRHAFGYKSPSSLRLDSVKPSSTMADFDKKLSEADAFLQILIDQTKALELRIQPMNDSDDRTKCEEILNHANDMLEQVKHTIVLLQIAKNIAHPVNGTYQPISPDTSIQSVGDGPQHRAPLGIPVFVPETSYSSSEEEDFYDAHDDSAPTLSARSSNDDDGFEAENISGVEAEGVGTPTETHSTDSNQTTPASVQTTPTSKFIKPNGLLDYDAMYEDTTETDISMESQGSVVTHLLSQVKIGMDLTKVVLPTFILERRSLLEMYADYFAHPDMFIRIAELESEQERMVQVVRWYLCSYHAGRKSSVAKKPYNPILGEIFQCYWDVSETPAEELKVTDGPIPWCGRHQLTFVAEQVSHHPPISAFYAEHFDKRISFNAHVWTKSKFLGLSIGVHNIGFGTVHVIDKDEKYIVTFPNGYGRSILTVPWIELGGIVKITCEKTGYNATIDFITKPFYGGKKHRINGEIFSPNEKKPFVTINGEWNGSMEAKWADGKTELFANVDDLTINKKVVRPVDQQSENESRRLWKEVTAGLRLNDVSYATKAKSEIEQKQRFEAQQRKQMGVTWETKLFHPIGSDKWQYNVPLAQRLIDLNR